MKGACQHMGQLIDHVPALLSHGGDKPRNTGIHARSAFGTEAATHAVSPLRDEGLVQPDYW